MVRIIRARRTVNKPALLMLHGAGSSAAIYRVQTHALAKALSPYFDLVYVDAPLQSQPGPGILPFFENMDAYYRWFGDGSTASDPKDASHIAEHNHHRHRNHHHDLPSEKPDHHRHRRRSSAAKHRPQPSRLLPNAASRSRGLDAMSQRMMELLDLSTYIPTQLEAQGVRSHDVVGIIGFSQGALAGLGLLGVEMAIGSPAWRSLRFCIAMGAATGGAAASHAVAGLVAAAAMAMGDKKHMVETKQNLFDDSGLFPGYTVHVVGQQDPWQEDSRTLVKMCQTRKTKVMEFNGGHWVPRDKVDIARLTELVLQTELESRVRPCTPSDTSSDEEGEFRMTRLDVGVKA